MKYKIAFVVVALIAGSQSFSQGIKSLTKGQKINMVQNSTMLMKMEMMGQEISQDMATSNTAELTVAELNDKGGKVEQKTTRMKMKMNAMGQEIDVDTDKPDENEQSKKMAENLNTATTCSINENGLITAIDIDKQLQSTMNNMPIGGMMSGQPLGFFLTLPANATVNQKWSVSFGTDSSMKTTYNYTIQSIENAVANLTFTGSMGMNNPIQANGMEMVMKLNGTITGTATVNLKTQFVTKRNSVMDLNGGMEMAGQSLPVDMKGTMEEIYTF
jgi:hypothetical protein